MINAMAGYSHSKLHSLEPPQVDILHGYKGELLLRHPQPAMLCGRLLPQVLNDQAASQPHKVFLRQRCGASWKTITYGNFVQRVNRLVVALHARGVRRGKVVAVLAENSIEHALLMMAILGAGAAIAPMAPQLLANHPAQAAELCRSLAVTAIAVDDPTAVIWPTTALKINLREEYRCEGWLSLEQLEEASSGMSPGANAPRIRPDMIAKIMFTSGSTGTPKPVVNTHGMLSAAQDIQGQLFAGMRTSIEGGYALTDWLPWCHTYGGNANLNSVIWAGGTLTIDAGKPTREEFALSIATLKEHPPTLFAGVPSSLMMLADALESDPRFAEHFFTRVQALSNGGAQLSEALVARLQTLAQRWRGDAIPIGGGYGMTETSAVITQVYWPQPAPNTLGLPPPGVEIKLVPIDERRYECRVRGPHVTPGHYSPRGIQTANLFDREGYFLTGDTLEFIDPDTPTAGLAFAGRLSEEFKLANGTWVRAGQLRGELVDTLHPLVHDAVITGENQHEVGALVWMSAGARFDDVLAQTRLFNADRRGASRRVARIAALASPPDPARGELVAKGNLNQVRMRATRCAEIARLFTTEGNL